jgi:acyl-coenzyme A thioesterase PaaI-like protein
VGRVVKQGRTIGYVECDVTDEKGREIARAACTCMTLRGEQARGR